LRRAGGTIIEIRAHGGHPVEVDDDDREEKDKRA
jgi:hypothetical protein